ncbi:MAG: 30S ribosomal protein S13 [Candidatus Micrarchaeota archaeon]
MVDDKTKEKQSAQTPKQTQKPASGAAAALQRAVIVKPGAKQEAKATAAAAHAPQSYKGITVKMTGKESKDFKGIVRILGKDIEGHTPLRSALRKIRGVGHALASNLARAARKELGLKESEWVGEMKDEDLAAIEEIVKAPSKHGVRSFQLNRARDKESGSDKHLTMADLQFAIRQDVEGEKNARSWKGYRFGLGQRVRGQHSRTTGRSGLTVGVLKKAMKAQKAAAASSAQDKGGEKEKK